MANKRYTEASEILTRIAKFNGANLTITNDDILNALDTKTSCEDKSKGDFDNTAKNTSVLYYLTNPISQGVKTVMLCYIFFSLALLYFGVSLGKSSWIQQNIFFISTNPLSVTFPLSKVSHQSVTTWIPTWCFSSLLSLKLLATVYVYLTAKCLGKFLWFLRSVCLQWCASRWPCVLAMNRAKWHGSQLWS